MSSHPLYKQVKEQIVESLARNEWRPGEMIPSEKQLAARYGVAISTVRAAVGELASSGVLVRTQGKGTHVAHHSARGNVYRFFNVVRNNGEKETFHRELLSLGKERASLKTAARLDLPSDRRPPEIFRLKIRLSAACPDFAFAEIILPAHLFAGLGVKAIPNGAASLYSLYQANYGVNVIRVVENLYAVRAGQAVAKALGLDRDEPVLQIDRTAYTFNDLPVELRTTWVHTKNYHYLIAQGAPG